ncbi:response regulator [Caballeronia sordidicola]|uniref:response regulator n=1 Tax=Caballeronia sordidicola TaxID=196367 RepID=UPI00094DA635|nr:response regulator [Caballeronia sordidicola]
MHLSSNKSRLRPWTQRRIKLGKGTLRVLVVDDNQNAAEALAAYLAFEKIDCQTAFGDAQAISVGVAWSPHVILMDISMPDCNGFQAALALRQDARTREITIIAFTALDEAEVLRHLTDHEFDGYFQKSQSPTHLLALISNFANQ